MSSLSISDITDLNNAEPNTVFGRDYGWKQGCVKIVFDPSANSTERAIQANTFGVTFPAKTVITKAYYKVLTTFTSATDAATLAVSVASANDIVSAVAISTGTTWDASGVIICVPTGAMSNEINLTAEGALTITTAVEVLTAGKLVLWVEFLYYGDV